MPEQEMEASSYPAPDKKPLEVKGSEIDYIVIVPKGVKSEASADKPDEAPERREDKPEEQGKMALPDKDKPLKISGSELESIVLTPKGSKKEEEKEMDKPKEPAEHAQAQDEKLAEFQEQFSAMKKEAQEWRRLYTDLHTQRVDEVVDQIVTLRLDQGLINDESVQPTRERLSKLPYGELKILLSDSKSLKGKTSPVKSTDGEAKIKLSQDPKEKMTKEQEVRLRYFGHKDPLPASANGGEQ